MSAEGALKEVLSIRNEIHAEVGNGHQIQHWLDDLENALRRLISRDIFSEMITETPKGWSEKYVHGWNDSVDSLVDKVRDGGPK